MHVHGGTLLGIRNPGVCVCVWCRAFSFKEKMTMIEKWKHMYEGGSAAFFLERGGTATQHDWPLASPTGIFDYLVVFPGLTFLP